MMMNDSKSKNQYNEELLQYAIDINWLINALSNNNSNEKIAYELTMSCMDVFFRGKDHLSNNDYNSYLIVKLKEIGVWLSILKNQYENKLDNEFDILINKNEVILKKL